MSGGRALARWQAHARAGSLYATLCMRCPPAHRFRFVRQESVTSSHITVGTVHLITVQSGKVGLCTVDSTAHFLEPGAWMRSGQLAHQQHHGYDDMTPTPRIAIICTVQAVTTSTTLASRSSASVTARTSTSTSAPSTVSSCRPAVLGALGVTVSCGTALGVHLHSAGRMIFTTCAVVAARAHAGEPEFLNPGRVYNIDAPTFRCAVTRSSGKTVASPAAPMLKGNHAHSPSFHSLRHSASPRLAGMLTPCP